MASVADDDSNLEAQIPISPAATRHRQMYKCSTPPWKDTFRKRCRDRLTSNRDALIHRYRSGISNVSDENEIKELISEEWNAMKRDRLVSLMDRSEDVDKLLSIFEEMSWELLAEEQAMISEYEKQLAMEDAEISQLVDSSSSDACHSARVICPICCQSPLYLDQTILRCSCGLHLDTEQDAITLDMIERNLTEGAEHHANNCTHRPQFSVVNQFGIINNLLMTCSVCDYMFVVV